MIESAPVIPIGSHVPDQPSKAEQIMLAYPGVMLAGAAFPVTVLLLMGLYQLCHGQVEQAVALFIFVLAGSVLGMLTATVVGLPCFLAVITFDYAFGKRMHPRTAGIVAGGLTGFVATGGFFLTVEWAWLLLPMTLAVVLGQWFAAAAYDRSYVPRHESPPAREWWRFEIRWLLLATAWIAVLLALLRLAGALRPSVAIGTAAWLIIQTTTLKVGRMFARKSG